MRTDATRSQGRGRRAQSACDATRRRRRRGAHGADDGGCHQLKLRTPPRRARLPRAGALLRLGAQARRDARERRERVAAALLHRLVRHVRRHRVSHCAGGGVDAAGLQRGFERGSVAERRRILEHDSAVHLDERLPRVRSHCAASGAACVRLCKLGGRKLAIISNHQR